MKSTDLFRLICGHICLHACMAGMRMASPLLALRDGYSAIDVGVLLALYSVAPVFLALPAGRFADRHGLQRPVGIAVAVAAFGAEVDFQFHRNYPPTLNHPAEAQFVQQVMTELVGADNALTFEPTMGAEDFSFFLQHRPGAYFVIGNGDGAHREQGHGLGPCTLHNPNYDFNDRLIPLGAALWVKLVERWLMPT